MADLVSGTSLLTYPTSSAVPSAQIPSQPGVAASPRVKTPAEMRTMEIDFAKAAETWETAAGFLQSEYAAAERCSVRNRQPAVGPALRA